jgi:regulator of protease activity HflC (stomatin/prohibitin superfamily)
VAALIVAFVVLLLISLAFTAHTVQSYKQGVVFRLGHFFGQRDPGLVMMPIHLQDVVTRDNLSVNVSIVSYYRVVDTTKSVLQSRTSRRSPRRPSDRSLVSTLLTTWSQRQARSALISN